jgi:hypothetical protein
VSTVYGSTEVRYSYIIPHTSYLISPISYLILHTSYLIPHTSYLISHTSYLVPALVSTGYGSAEVLASIAHTERIFSAPVLPLPTRREYSQPLSSHCPHGENILSPCPPIAHTERISQPLSSHCPHGENILSPCPSIGHTERIFSYFRTCQLRLEAHHLLLLNMVMGPSRSHGHTDGMVRTALHYW